MNTANQKISRRDAESAERVGKRKGGIHGFPHGISMVLACLLVAVSAVAEPMFSEGTAETDKPPAPDSTLYSLVAKVRVRSVDRGTECVYWEFMGQRSIGYPLDVELIETLWQAEDFAPSRLLVPARFELPDGLPRPDPDLEAGRYAEGEIMPLVCRRDGDWSVVQWIVEAGTWEKYRRQKAEGTFGRGFSPEDDAEEECLAAVREIKKLRKRLEDGEFSREEYLRLREPFDVILSRPKYCVLY